MNFIKLIGGLFALILGILIHYWNKKESKKVNNYDEGVYDNPIDKSIDFQGYLFSFILICTGIGLIISAFL
jgi:hypothetical protein